MKMLGPWIMGYTTMVAMIYASPSATPPPNFVVSIALAVMLSLRNTHEVTAVFCVLCMYVCCMFVCVCWHVCESLTS